MTRIPIDVTAPIACTASASEIPLRIDQVSHLRDRLRSISRSTEGLVLTFDPDPDLRAHLERFVLDEKGCCQFWGFETTKSPTELALRWTGPPTVQSFLDELHRYFTSDEPLTAFSGLL